MRPLARTGVALALVLGAAACSVGPEWMRPQTAAPAAWTEPPADSAVAWPSAEWWRGFGSGELDALIMAAQANNTDIAAAAARIAQADARARIAGAALYPEITGGADARRAYTGRANSLTGRSRTTVSYGATAAASYEIDFWGRNRAALTAAEALALASRFERETVAITVTSNVAATYFRILAFQDRLAIAHDNLANAERVLGVVQARVDAGAASDLELAQQRTVVANQRAALPPLEQQLRQSANALSVLLGAPPEAVAVRGGSLDMLRFPAVAPGLPSELLARRPDIANAEALLRSANADIRAARAALFPSIDLTGQGGFESVALASLFNSAGFFYSLVAGLTQPIFSGGRLEGQVELSQARYEELLQTYRATVIAAFADTEDALVALRQLARQQTLQEQAVAQAQRAFELADARFRAGAVDLLTVLDAQRSLFSARDQFVQIRSARLQALVSLFRALGGGWTPGEIPALSGAGQGAE